MIHNMSIVKQLRAMCDRCGYSEKVPSPYDHDEADLPYGWDTLEGFAWEVATCGEQMDICTDCVNSFEKWIANGKKS